MKQPPAFAHLKPARQRGAASLAIAVVLLLVLTGVLYASLSLSSSVVLDATASDLRVQSLFLAESGMERATQRYTKGASCASASNETVAVAGVGNAKLEFMGASNFDGTACSAAVCGSSYCRIRSTGQVLAGGNTVDARTIEALVIPKSLTAAGARNPPSTPLSGGVQRYTLTNTVSAGTNQLFILTILWSTTSAKPGKVIAVTYSGAPVPAMVLVAPSTLPTFPTGTGYYAQIWYAKDPPTGTSNVYIDFNDSPAGVAVGTLNADGVDPTTPIYFKDSISSSTSVSTLTRPVAIPPNGLAIDVLSRNNGGNATGKPCTDPGDATVSLQTIYSSNAAKVAGETSYCGPVSASGVSFNMGYTFGSAPASYAVAVIQPDNSASGGKRVRLGGSAGVLKWHEVVTTPP